MSPELARAVAAGLGEQIASAAAVAGGDVNRAVRVTTGSGRSVFVKHRSDAPAGMYRAEAEGLLWLAEAGAARLPAVLAVAEVPPRFLALEWIERGAPAADHDERLGVALAALHAAGAPAFGLADDNFIATIPQSNVQADSWSEFYATRRLEPLVRAARAAGLISTATSARFEALYRRLPELCGPPEPPARLHGDLWSGNAIVDAAGHPVLIDPAAYGGHREVDLAMMRLFGGFGARVFAAYREAGPLAAGHEERVNLYQLWPLLVHVNLFGRGYTASLERALSQYE